MIAILRAPPFATVQDLGRSGYLDAAVPRAGALDPLALAVGNLLVGNPSGLAAMEWGLGGGEIRFERDATVALTGARATAMLGGRPIAPNRLARVRAGEELVVERLEAGAWLYLAVSGGIDVPPVLGSRSTYLPARFGGFEGRLLRAGDRLPLGPEPRAAPPELCFPTALLPDPASAEPIALLAGPDRELLPAGGWERLLGTEFKVSRAVSRSGYRLIGGPPAFLAADDRPSAPVSLGTLQLPAGGEPIVLLPDGPTVGGYARVGVVATGDLGRLAQRRPGDLVRFEETELAEAQERLRRQGELLGRLERRA